eukprot:TRINITY_DN68163_c0_g1_i1.p1 TRINITY_DN68163_c0_g1~~TRINITY_DN68163_c0_g1_i1.p1  ORF type:complete len:622 (-),score=99.49 TRINITY_DN68163_c0_g1_i1:280-2145(-)
MDLLGGSGRLAAVISAMPLVANTFYLPGVAPLEYQEGSLVDIKVNKLMSTKTQLPFEYYTLAYCRPAKLVKSVENLGEILVGDLIENSPYEIHMLQNESCKVLCKSPITPTERNKFQSMIDDEYSVNMLVDNLPASTRYVPPGQKSFKYDNGFPVGQMYLGNYFVNNHLTIDIMYHSQPNEYNGYRVVGFEIQPHSVDQDVTKAADSTLSATCSTSKSFELGQRDSITFTYDVRWFSSEVRWASRWDAYLKVSGGRIHWFSISNSIMIMVFLTGMVAMILMRTLHRDIANYNEIATAEEAAEETGWKLVHGDVFRRPKFSKLLAVSVGSGAQILGMSVVTLVFALAGILSPAHRGGLLQCCMIVFTFMGVLGGYIASRLYVTFNGEDWKTMTLMMSLLYPGIFFGVFFTLNLFIWGQKSSGAVPFNTMFALLVLWFGISVPLVFFGSTVGRRAPPIELPVRVNPIPRQIPMQPWYTKRVPVTLAGGLLPFAAIFTELFFIIQSIWQHQFYYLFGFLTIVLCILVVVCAELSIAVTYFQLVSEDYHWWWRSFLASGTSGMYVFLYSALYFATRLQIEKFVSTLLFFGYMFLMSVTFFLITGCVGLLASFFFVKAIYGSIKVD